MPSDLIRSDLMKPQPVGGGSGVCAPNNNNNRTVERLSSRAAERRQHSRRAVVGGFLLRHSETCGRGRVRDFHGAHLSFAGARRSLFFVGFALPLENREENDAFLAFVRWALPRMLANHLFLRFIAFSRSSSSLSLFVLFTSFFSTSLPLLR